MNPEIPFPSGLWQQTSHWRLGRNLNLELLITPAPCFSFSASSRFSARSSSSRSRKSELVNDCRIGPSRPIGEIFQVMFDHEFDHGFERMPGFPADLLVDFSDRTHELHVFVRSIEGRIH
jgi:hypothetical protein